MTGLYPGDLVGPYVIEERQGDGSTATVYRAHHPTLRSRHALKMVHGPLGLLHRLLAFEAKLQATVSHPNVVRLIEVLPHQGAPVLVLEYVPGQTLEQLLSRGPLPLELVDVLARDLLNGLRAIHDADIVHRDLKPANILLLEAGEDWLAKIADFGIARPQQLPSELAFVPGPLGTPRYMAPEQYNDARQADRRSDLFSFGCLLYEMLTGRPAFPGEDLAELRSRIGSGEFVPIRVLRSGVPARMIHMVERCLQVDPAGRPADCKAALAMWSGSDRQPKTIPGLPLAEQPTMAGARPRGGSPVPVVHKRAGRPLRAPRKGRRVGMWALTASALLVMSAPFALGFGLIALAAGQPSLTPHLLPSARLGAEVRVETPTAAPSCPDPAADCPSPPPSRSHPRPRPQDPPLLPERTARPPSP
jgi:serine/threonine protein kinase